MKCSEKIAIYDVSQSYLQNAEEGPYFTNPIEKRELPPQSEWFNFLGYRVASRIGVPAGPLLNSKWIKLAANLHYDIVCYKTIRTQEHMGHPIPNIIYIDGKKQLTDLDQEIYQIDTIPDELTDLGITNSFGMPSRSREYLFDDIPKANRALHEGQVMIVSIVGTPSYSGNIEDLISDFVKAAVMAQECGAKVIEANLSCPNVGGKQGFLYLDPTIVRRITQQIVHAIDPIPLILKVGNYPNKAILRSVLHAAEFGGARAISGINSLSLSVLKSSGEPALGPARLTSGVCGAPIRQTALTFIQESRSVIDEDHLNLLLIGCGGITDPTHFDQFYAAGAEIAMTATGMMWDPYLAIKYDKLMRKS